MTKLRKELIGPMMSKYKTLVVYATVVWVVVVCQYQQLQHSLCLRCVADNSKELNTCLASNGHAVAIR